MCDYAWIPCVKITSAARYFLLMSRLFFLLCVDPGSRKKKQPGVLLAPALSTLLETHRKTSPVLLAGREVKLVLSCL
jgi:hypothetical protein